MIPLPGPSEPRFTGHALTVTGYDDQQQWFIIRNSLGKSWGDEGHGYIPYAYLMNPKLATVFWVVRKV